MESKPLAKKQTRNVVEFKRLKLHNIEYNVGDAVQVKEHTDDACYATILKIFKDPKVKDAFIKIKWFYKPHEAFHAAHDFFSERELIDSDLIQDISVQCIYGKIRVLSFLEYHALDEVEDDVYFTRATYTHKEDVVRPPLSE